MLPGGKHEYGSSEAYIMLIGCGFFASISIRNCAYDSYLYFNPAPASAPQQSITRIEETVKVEPVWNCIEDDSFIGCKASGNCTNINGVCQPTKDEHCAQSLICEYEGRCSFYKRDCMPTKDEHCANSSACKESGICSLTRGPVTWYCEPTKPKHCAQSEDCKFFGRCSLVNYGDRFYCFVTSEKECAKSDLCKEKGMCSLDRRKDVMMNKCVKK